MTSGNNNDRLEVLSKEAYEVMANEIANYGCKESLILIKRFIRKMNMQKRTIFEFRGQAMGFHVFPLFIDLIIRYGTMLTPTKRLDGNTIEWLFGKYVDFPEIMLVDKSEANKNRYVSEYWLRSAFEQLTIQEMSRNLVQRMLYLYVTIPNSNPDKHKPFIDAISEVLANQFRVTLDDILYCTFTLGAIAESADQFQEKLLTEVDWMKPYVESDAMGIVRSMLTLSKDNYIIKAKEQFAGEYKYARTDPHIIYRYPIIKLDEYYICPYPKMLLNIMTKNIHGLINQYFLDNNKLQEFSGVFGNVFKDYIGLLLKECYGSENVYDIDQLPEIKTRKADWLVIKDNLVGIFECKALRYPRELKRTGSLDILESFVNSKFPDAIEQLVQTERSWPIIKETLNNIDNDVQIYKYMVIEENMQLVNVLSNFLPENGVITKLQKEHILIVTPYDLETLVSSNYADNFLDTFIKWRENIGNCPTLHQHIQELPGFSHDKNNFLDNKFREYFHLND